MSDRADFDDFFRADFPLLVGFLRKQGHDRATAEDAAQEAMTKALALWDGITHRKAWVRKAGLRIANDHRRRQEREDWTPEEDPVATANGSAGYEERELIVQALSRLPPRQREVLAWYIDGYSTGEIAALLSTRVSTVRSNLRHARKQLDDLHSRLRETEGGDHDG
ncbi:sigma-70 family RNA polymerase sigma factor [Amycolatopsis sp. NPDC023774]|uniref:RNA polymerase sigma factor n=1 Tax=Amycolatopsis sp. NPDC023774 TaxID=3155015 RepID=UPI00340C1E60